jgi:hypothetical protein
LQLRSALICTSPAHMFRCACRQHAPQVSSVRVQGCGTSVCTWVGCQTHTVGLYHAQYVRWLCLGLCQCGFSYPVTIDNFGLHMCLDCCSMHSWLAVQECMQPLLSLLTTRVRPRWTLVGPSSRRSPHSKAHSPACAHCACRNDAARMPSQVEVARLPQQNSSMFAWHGACVAYTPSNPASASSHEQQHWLTGSTLQHVRSVSTASGMLACHAHMHVSAEVTAAWCGAGVVLHVCSDCSPSAMYSACNSAGWKVPGHTHTLACCHSPFAVVHGVVACC